MLELPDLLPPPYFPWFDTGLVFETHPTGSRYTVFPAPMDTDEDHIVWVRNLAEFRDLAFSKGFVMDSEEAYEGDEFNSFRLGEVNLIVTEDHSFYSSMVTATLLCKRLNLHIKADRIAVFEAVQKGIYVN